MQPTTVRLPDELYDWLRDLAHDTRTPINTHVVRALEQYRRKLDAERRAVERASA